MDRFYAPGTVVRWEPAAGLPELPLSAFDLTWSHDGTLLCTGLYGHNSTDDYKGVMVAFEGVHAFASFDGFSDILLNYSEHPLPLKVPVPYGGCWPFVEVQGSRWVRDIVDEHSGMPDTQRFVHWSVLTYDQTLHVMAPKGLPPLFKGFVK
jgi:hypothetical protein